MSAFSVPGFITAAVAAQHLGISYDAMILWLKARRIEHLKIRIKKRDTWLVSELDLARFITENTVARKVEDEEQGRPRRVGRPSIIKMEAKRG